MTWCHFALEDGSFSVGFYYANACFAARTISPISFQGTREVDETGGPPGRMLLENSKPDVSANASAFSPLLLGLRSAPDLSLGTAVSQAGIPPFSLSFYFYSSSDISRPPLTPPRRTADIACLSDPKSPAWDMCSVRAALYFPPPIPVPALVPRAWVWLVVSEQGIEQYKPVRRSGRVPDFSCICVGTLVYLPIGRITHLSEQDVGEIATLIR
ncbi:hypothetical protein L209DRAFT_749690 [Thermothelomyces heterothallicus CBS 203.75]